MPKKLFDVAVVHISPLDLETITFISKSRTRIASLNIQSAYNSTHKDHAELYEVNILTGSNNV